MYKTWGRKEGGGRKQEKQGDPPPTHTPPPPYIPILNSSSSPQTYFLFYCSCASFIYTQNIHHLCRLLTPPLPYSSHLTHTHTHTRLFYLCINFVTKAIQIFWPQKKKINIVWSVFSFSTCVFNIDFFPSSSLIFITFQFFIEHHFHRSPSACFYTCRPAWI